MAMLDSQGDNLTIPKLDKYRQVIGDLLVALSGKITDSTSEGTLSTSEGTGTNNLRQELAKIVQGWMTGTNESPKEGQLSSGQATSNNPSVIKALDHLVELSGEITDTAQKGNFLSSEGVGTKDLSLDMAKIVQSLKTLTDALSEGRGTGNSELNAKAFTLLAALYPILNQGVQALKASQGAGETLQVEDEFLEPITKGRLETLANQGKGMGNILESATTVVKATAFLTNAQQKSAGVGEQKGEATHSAELSGVKDVQTQTSSVGVGMTSNIVAVTLADGKIASIPVWEQISTVVREQVMNRQQALKELDIQLHPADLGKIQIFLRWESGQVHLQVHASEAATGQLLQNQLSELRQNLTSQGVNCGSLQMGQGGERQQQSQGDEARRALQQGNSLPNEDEDITPIHPRSMGADGINRINVTA